MVQINTTFVSLQSGVATIATEILIVGIIMAVVGFFLYKKSKPEQKIRRKLGIILLVMGFLFLLLGIVGVVEAPSIVRNSVP